LVRPVLAAERVVGLAIVNCISFPLRGAQGFGVFNPGSTNSSNKKRADRHARKYFRKKV
jgi:hypothetical protein